MFKAFNKFWFTRVLSLFAVKTFKTSIINGCDCPNTDNNEQNKLIYASLSNAIQDNVLSVKYEFRVGDFVWAKKSNEDKLYKGEIISILDGIYTVNFDDNVTENFSYCNLYIYFNCDECIPNASLQESYFSDLPYQRQFASELSENNIYCNILNFLSTESLI
jgi:hypothetical protein